MATQEYENTVRVRKQIEAWNDGYFVHVRAYRKSRVLKFWTKVSDQSAFAHSLPEARMLAEDFKAAAVASARLQG